MKDGDQFGYSVSVFEYFPIIGSCYCDITKGRVYLNKIFFGEWKYHQKVQAKNGSDGNGFSFSAEIYDKNMIIGSHNKDDGRVVYIVTMQGKTWKEETKLTGIDGASGDQFGSSVAISRDTLIVGDSGRDEYGGGTNMFVLAGYG